MANERYMGPTPRTNPELFDTVPSKDAQAGDIFQGQKNSSKWYVSKGGSAVDPWRTYYRRKPLGQAAPAGTSAPAPSGPAGSGVTTAAAGTADGTEQQALVHFSVKITNRSKFLALLAAVGETMEGEEAEGKGQE